MDIDRKKFWDIEYSLGKNLSKSGNHQKIRVKGFKFLDRFICWRKAPCYLTNIEQLKTKCFLEPLLYAWSHAQDIVRDYQRDKNTMYKTMKLQKIGK